jgi:hypothetical protein
MAECGFATGAIWTRPKMSECDAADDRRELVKLVVLIAMAEARRVWVSGFGVGCRVGRGRVVRSLACVCTEFVGKHKRLLHQVRLVSQSPSLVDGLHALMGDG